MSSISHTPLIPLREPLLLAERRYAISRRHSGRVHFNRAHTYISAFAHAYSLAKISPCPPGYISISDGAPYVSPLRPPSARQPFSIGARTQLVPVVSRAAGTEAAVLRPLLSRLQIFRVYKHRAPLCSCGFLRSMGGTSCRLTPRLLYPPARFAGPSACRTSARRQMLVFAHTIVRLIRLAGSAGMIGKIALYFYFFFFLFPLFSYLYRYLPYIQATCEFLQEFRHK